MEIIKEPNDADLTKINPFEVLKEMTEKNMGIYHAPLSNIVRIMATGKGYEITIGVPTSLGERIAKGEKFNGGFIVANADQYRKTENTLLNK